MRPFVSEAMVLIAAVLPAFAAWDEIMMSFTINLADPPIRGRRQMLEGSRVEIFSTSILCRNGHDQ